MSVRFSLVYRIFSLLDSRIISATAQRRAVLLLSLPKPQISGHLAGEPFAQMN